MVQKTKAHGWGQFVREWQVRFGQILQGLPVGRLCLVSQVPRCSFHILGFYP